MTKKPLAKNSVLTVDDIVEMEVIGDQTPESVQATAEEGARLGRELMVMGKPVLLLDNVSRVGKVSPRALRRVIKMGKTVTYDRLALVSNKPREIAMSNFVLRAIGKSGKVKFFVSREEAIKWLKKSVELWD